MDRRRTGTHLPRARGAPAHRLLVIRRVELGHFSLALRARGSPHAVGPAGLLHRDGRVWLVFVARRTLGGPGVAARGALAGEAPPRRRRRDRAALGRERMAVELGDRGGGSLHRFAYGVGQCICDLARGAQGAGELAVLDRARFSGCRTLLVAGPHRDCAALCPVRSDRRPGIPELALEHRGLATARGRRLIHGRRSRRSTGPRLAACASGRSRDRNRAVLADRGRRAQPLLACGDCERPLVRAARARRGTTPGRRLGERGGAARHLESRRPRARTGAHRARAGLLVSEFVPGRILTRDEARSPARVAAIGHLLRELHDLAPSPGIRRLDFATQARTLESQLGASSHAAFATQAAAVFARLEAGQGAPVPCHNDLHAQNILEHDRRLLLVDWEYGGLGDPVYDLAGCVIHFALGAAQRELLLDAYGMRAPRARLRDACWAYDYVQWLWYRVAAGQPGDRSADVLAEAASAVARRLERSQGAG